MARWLALFALALALASACASRSAPDDQNGAGDDGGGDDESGLPPPAEGASCESDTCVPAASTCCGCPSFAVPADEGWQEACEGVPCERPTDCPAVVAACVDDVCRLACAPVACERVCEQGFAVDVLGCVTCACATPRGPACDGADDCVQVPADCCGCARGGAETAVHVDAVDDHRRGLACTGDEVCPEVDVCHSAAAPVCRSSHCVLGLGEPSEPGSSLPEGACGRADLPRCPDGQRCVLNRSPAADAAGVGICAAT